MKRLIACAIVATATSAQAEIVATNETKHYDVVGRTHPDMIEYMNKNGPQNSESNRHWHAMTKWNVSANYSYQQLYQGDELNSLCVMKSVKVSFTIEMTLPRLVGNASAQGRKSWDKMNINLVKHEGGHAQIAQDFAEALDKELVELRAPTCPELVQKAKDTYSRLRESSVAEQSMYDHVTKHGLNQSAWKPKPKVVSNPSDDCGGTCLISKFPQPNVRPERNSRR